MSLRSAQFFLVILALTWCGPALVQQAPKKVALLIGNSGYVHVPALSNPANDASDIGAALSRLGFSVTVGLDYDYRKMRLALRDFAGAAADADIALIYFAGHGIEIAKTNYLNPVNAELKNDRDVDSTRSRWTLSWPR